MINFKFNLIINDLSEKMQLRRLVWYGSYALGYEAFLCRKQIKVKQYRIQFDISPYPLQFFSNTPFNKFKKSSFIKKNNLVKMPTHLSRFSV